MNLYTCLGSGTQGNLTRSLSVDSAKYGVKELKRFHINSCHLTLRISPPPSSLIKALSHSSIFLGAASFLPNLNCKPRETVIETSKDFKYFPYYVNLNRCSGSEGQKPPVFVQCVPSKEEKVYVTASLSSEVSRTKRAGIELELMNHTSCKTECLIREEDCKAPAVYDKKRCRCICDTGIARPSRMRCKDPRKM